MLFCVSAERVVSSSLHSSPITFEPLEGAGSTDQPRCSPQLTSSRQAALTTPRLLKAWFGDDALIDTWGRTVRSGSIMSEICVDPQQHAA